MSLEELQRLILLAFRFGGVTGYLLSGDESVTITFDNREALEAYLQVLPGERCRYLVSGLSVLIQPEQS